MPTGIKPRVNEAREFLEIAKDFKDPREIMREALSNSWDAGAKKVALKFDLQKILGTRAKKIMVEIDDDGEGMSDERRKEIGTSEIEDFFNLGDSHKPHGSIGTKGHGTKIYYKSGGIIVDTWKNGTHIHAETEVPPWKTLKGGYVPTYRYEKDSIEGKGTKILIDGFEGKQSEFESIQEVIEYIQWYTVFGSFGNYFGTERKMDVELKTFSLTAPVSVKFGFMFPNENTDLSKGSEDYCKIFGPETIDCGKNDEGEKVTVNVIGAVLGESKRGLIPHTYEMSGIWLCKDFIKVERNNSLIEEIFGGQYFYRSMLIFANSQQFDLTANRNNIRSDQEEYYLAITAIKNFIRKIKDDPATNSYFATKKLEDEMRQKQLAEETIKKRRSERRKELDQRLDEYKGRPELLAPNVKGALLKEPKSEAETALLLQAMISSDHPGIDFRIGEYKTWTGTDLLVEYINKGIPSYAWVEIVGTLEKLFTWAHPPEEIHKVVCWQLGNVSEHLTFTDGKTAKLGKKGNGRYHLDIGVDSIDVYVLREILQSE